MSDAFLSAQNVSYEVGTALLVNGVDVAARPGEFLAILGPNGAGKSTLLSVLSGELIPSSGSVCYDSIDISALSGPERAVRRAVFSDRTPIDVPFTARAVVEFGRFPHRHDTSISPDENAERIRTAMELTDTPHLANRVYATLSGGERTRVALARVFAQDTPIVLLDEPTTALDVYHQERVLRILRTSADRGRTVVAILHDLNGAAAYADRILVMAEGRVRAQGPVADVLEPVLLSDVYGQPMEVIDHPLRAGKLVLIDDRQA